MRALFDNTVVEWPSIRGEYCADGTGTVFAYGETFPRTWTVEGDDRVCVAYDGNRDCFTFEADTTDPMRVRSRNLATDERVVVKISYREPRTCRGEASAPCVRDTRWVPVTGFEELRAIYSNTVVEWRNMRGEYCADGTGTVFAWGETFARTWAVEGEDRVCVTYAGDEACYSFERDTTSPNRYRVRNLDSEERVVLEISYRQPRTCRE